MALTYNYCQICGHRPDENEELNATRKWWDADDGWRIGALCRWCWEDAEGDRPKPEDWAFAQADEMHLANVDTDEDPTELI